MCVNLDQMLHSNVIQPKTNDLTPQHLDEEIITIVSLQCDLTTSSEKWTPTFRRPIASDKFPRPIAPKNNPHMKMAVEMDDAGITAVSQIQLNLKSFYFS